MRSALVAALVCLLVLPAHAQPVESVTVNANAVPGLWKLTHPHYVGKSGLFGDFNWGPPRDSFCRMEGSGSELIYHCLASGEGTAALSGNHIHLAWGSMMARLVIDAEFQSETSFSGHSAVKLAGIGIQDPDLSSGVKINPALQAIDKGGKAGLLRTIVSNSLAQVPHDPHVKDALQERAKLGSAQAFFYLGQQVKSETPEKDVTEFFAVYAIEFDNGERICGLHQQGDGTLDAFQCA